MITYDVTFTVGPAHEERAALEAALSAFIAVLRGSTVEWSAHEQHDANPPLPFGPRRQPIGEPTE